MTEASNSTVRANGTPTSIAEAIGKTGPFSSFEQEVFINLLRTASSLAEPFDALFRANGLSEPQYNALRILRGHGKPIPSGTVAEQMVTRDPDITRLLDRLAKAGLVERAKSERDKRVVLAAITEKGLELLARLDEPILELHRKQFESMPREQLWRLSELLTVARNTD